MRWRIYYADGATHDGSTDKEAWYAPAVGVICIAVEDVARSKGFGLTAERNMYLYRDGRFWGCDEAGMWDYWFTHPGPKTVLFGRTIKTDNWNDIMQRAIKEGLGVQ